MSAEIDFSSYLPVKEVFDPLITVYDILERYLDQQRQEAEFWDVVLPTSLPEIYMNKVRFMQMIESLLVQSARYRVGAANVIFSMEQLAVGDGSLLAVSIKDDGFGLDANRYNQALEEEVLLVNRTVAGKDLSLAALKKLVNVYKGYFSVISEWRKGTNFRLCLSYEQKSLYASSSSNVVRLTTGNMAFQLPGQGSYLELGSINVQSLASS